MSYSVLQKLKKLQRGDVGATFVSFHFNDLRFEKARKEKENYIVIEQIIFPRLYITLCEKLWVHSKILRNGGNLVFNLIHRRKINYVAFNVELLSRQAQLLPFREFLTRSHVNIIHLHT